MNTGRNNVKKWVKRSLTRAFGRAAARDRMLADLYVAVRQETCSPLVVDHAVKLAYTFNDQYEIGQCIATMLDYIHDAEGPRSAIKISDALLKNVRAGAVLDAIMSRAGSLHHYDSIAHQIRKETAIYLSSFRLAKELTLPGLVEMYMYGKDIPRRQLVVQPRPMKLTPLEFQKHMNV